MTPQRATSTPQYKAYTLANFREIPQLAALSEEQKFAAEVVGSVLPFRTNRYVVEELIDWDAAPDDPIFTLTFPRREMLLPRHFAQMADLIKGQASAAEIRRAADDIREQLNPHGQMDNNVPILNGERLSGMQHKYRETVLFFPARDRPATPTAPSASAGPSSWATASLSSPRQAETLVEYVRTHPEVSDILFTGGDPMIMKSSALASYIEPLLDADLPSLRTIRIGTKSLSYWSFRYLTDPDAGEVLALFERIVKSGRHLAIAAHFNHPRDACKYFESRRARCGKSIRATGAQIRTQSPVLSHINDSSALGGDVASSGTFLGMIPYYMFVVRDTRSTTGVPLERASGRSSAGVQQRERPEPHPCAAPACRPTPAKVQCWASVRCATKKSLRCASSKAATRSGCTAPSLRSTIRKPCGWTTWA